MFFDIKKLPNPEKNLDSAVFLPVRQEETRVIYFINEWRQQASADRTFL
jgi:hypothetical protein